MDTCGLTVTMAVSQVWDLHGIPALVRLFSSDSRAVLRYATGATRNLIYENSDNKAALVDAGGVARLVGILSEPDEELRKTVTGTEGLTRSPDHGRGFPETRYRQQSH